MAATADTVSLKLVIDRKSQRVLFAEADKEFVDFLFSIFTLPVGTVTRLLKEDGSGGMVGCLPSLYRSIENLSSDYIQPSIDKRFLLRPKIIMPGAKPPLLLPDVGSTFRQLYGCSCGGSDGIDGNDGSGSTRVADDYRTICPKCDYKMDGSVTLVDPLGEVEVSFWGEEGYVKGTVTYMVMDDLKVKPMSTASVVTLFTRFNVNFNEIGAIEEKMVEFGMDDGVKLLRASLQSKTVLTDVFLSGSKK
ncbi:uncharacterized protein LOC132167426 [Corylus avellana]|uniref:uncharacterized protein LOC132167426 n=1 Tax=Corylus avellana TaxID=13451 RepID=UPI001E1F3E8D|nr:uncharacterized protein LOC132167426 [Corylus avellana]